MNAKQLITEVRGMVQRLCEKMELTLWDVTFEKEGRSYVLTVYIDRKEGVFIEDCENISRALDPMLDDPKYDELPSYTLSVSSAGLERKLVREEHFAWAVGKTVTLTFYKLRSGADSVTGTLISYAGEFFVINDESIPKSEIASAHLYFTM